MLTIVINSNIIVRVEWVCVELKINFKEWASLRFNMLSSSPVLLLLLFLLFELQR